MMTNLPKKGFESMANDDRKIIFFDLKSPKLMTEFYRFLIWKGVKIPQNFMDFKFETPQNDDKKREVLFTEPLFFDFMHLLLL